MATGANTTPLGLNPILAARQAAAAIPALQNRQPSMLPQTQLLPQQQQPQQVTQQQQQQPAQQTPQKHSTLDTSSRQALTAHIEAAKRAAEAVTSHLPKRRKTRWGNESEKSTAVPTQLPSHLSEEEQKKYLIHIRIEELNKMLRAGDYGIPERQENRSPSPEPFYDHKGVRLNTRESRMKKRMEEERHKLIQDAIQLNPDYKPPSDYKPPQIRIQDRVSIPQDENPHINFIGLIIGPRGNTLKKLEKDTNTKVMIRGKGSVKEGKTPRPGVKPDNAEDEELHALVTGQTCESVKKCVDKIKDVIRQGVDAPEGQSDLKRLQLLELAALNGTLRADEVARCRNCGATSHKTWECPEQTNFTNEVMCAECGGRGHVAKDCIVKKPQPEDKSNIIIPQHNSLVEAAPPSSYLTGGRGKVDAEYQSFMAELTGKPAAPGNNSSGRNQHQPPPGGHGGYGGRGNVPPPQGLTGRDNTGGITVYDHSKSGPMPWNKPAGARPHAAANNPPWAPNSSSAGQVSTPSSSVSSTMQSSHGGPAPPGVTVPPGTNPMPRHSSLMQQPPPMSMAPPHGAAPPPPGVMQPMGQQYSQMGQPPPPGSTSVPPWQQAAPAPWQQQQQQQQPPSLMGMAPPGTGGYGMAMQPPPPMGPPGVVPPGVNPPPPGTQPPPWASGPPR
ncbi:splicing factor 1-like isoform X2 [Sycon ciliatum]|uniref:splicing factor 1-like isoform X2 n=1 Tax=Sycon ciliatum TaxID=27933 RepID=UPI0031F65817